MIEDLDEKTYEILFSIKRSILYHQHRRRFYETWHNITILISLTFGFITVGFLLSDMHKYLNIIVASVVATISMLDLAKNPNQKSNLHADFARKFINLETQIDLNTSLSNKKYSLILKERLNIESNEPSILHLLNALCHYQILRSLGDEVMHPIIPCWRRVLSHFFSQENYAKELPREEQKEN